MRFARAEYSAGYRPSIPAAASYTPAPYLIADEAVFGPGMPPALTLSASAPVASSPRNPRGRAPMSQILGATFGTDPAAALPQVQRAYERLKALGL
ncbi:MAG: hypothetical protein EAY70_07055 [Sphingomonadales bacterium]|nr:MAG: hypothetical protein EAY70_07055 [Sphingomonadales bacterium]